MLVLTRQEGQHVVITIPDGREVVVTMVEVRGDHRARIGFTADPDIKIMREELQIRIDREGQQPE